MFVGANDWGDNPCPGCTVIRDLVKQYIRKERDQKRKKEKGKDKE